MSLDFGLGTVGVGILGFFIGLIFWAIFFSEETTWRGDIIREGHPVWGLTITLGCVLIGAIVGSTLPADVYYTTHTPIYTISGALGVHGAFALGYGSVDSSPVFVYYAGDDTHGFKLYHRYAEHSTIFRDEENNPYMKSLCVRRGSGTNSCYAYEFHVPKGALVQQYNLNV